jgi:hypothetical protein
VFSSSTPFLQRILKRDVHKELHGLQSVIVGGYIRGSFIPSGECVELWLLGGILRPHHTRRVAVIIRIQVVCEPNNIVVQKVRRKVRSVELELQIE